MCLVGAAGLKAATAWSRMGYSCFTSICTLTLRFKKNSSHFSIQSGSPVMAGSLAGQVLLTYTCIIQT